MSLTILLITFTLRLMAPESGAVIIPVGERIDPFKQLIFAVGMVESSRNTMAYNASEAATGYFQIRPIRLRDYNDRTGNSYKIDDMFNYAIAEKVFRYYCHSPYEIDEIILNWNCRSKEYLLKVRRYL